MGQSREEVVGRQVNCRLTREQVRQLEALKRLNAKHPLARLDTSDPMILRMCLAYTYRSLVERDEAQLGASNGN